MERVPDTSTIDMNDTMKKMEELSQRFRSKIQQSSLNGKIKILTPEDMANYTIIGKLRSIFNRDLYYLDSHGFWTPPGTFEFQEFKDTQRLGDKPSNEDEEKFKSEFRKLDFASGNDLFYVDFYPRAPYVMRGFKFFSRQFSENRLTKSNYDDVIKDYIPQTHLFVDVRPGYKIEIERIGVNPRYQGQGLGRKLVEVTERIGAVYGAKEIQATQPVSNVGFWQKMCFREYLDEEVEALEKQGWKVRIKTKWAKPIYK